ncbi:MAG: shikimate dehydrogenase, partial [Bacteroidota bacterium]|nr:shikimate dehydrogenase [Bacteroidota bacterium]
MRKYGLIGFPLGHSFSQKYFTEKFAREQIRECSYENFPVDSVDRLPELIRDNPDICGLNVTIPHKTNILKYVDVKDPAVIEIGAANVLKIKRIEGTLKIYGYNSDITGICDSVMPFISGNFRNAMILGTGGSSRAVGYALEKLGLRVSVVTRKRSPGLINYRDITASLIEKTEIIINTTPLGMFPDIDSYPEIDYDLLNENHVL